MMKRCYVCGEENHEKVAAHMAVRNAIRRGLIVRPAECPECGGSERRIEAHHDDYTKPLDIRWLCAACHKAWHREIGWQEPEAA